MFTPMEHAHSTYIQTLRLASDERDKLALRLRLSHNFAALDVSPPELPPHALLCVRHLRIVRERHRGTSRVNWERTVASEIRELFTHAARPALAEPAMNAAAVLFMDRAEMLACLASDWCTGKLYQRWWWQHLFGTYDARNLPIRIWQETPHYIPAAMQRLTSQQQVLPFLRQLPAPAAHALLVEMLRHFGLHALYAVCTEEVSVKYTFSTEGSEPIQAILPDKDENTHNSVPWQQWLPEYAVLDLPTEQQLLLATSLLLARTPAIVRTTAFARDVQQWKRRELRVMGVSGYVNIKGGDDVLGQQVQMQSPIPILPGPLPLHASEIEDNRSDMIGRVEKKDQGNISSQQEQAHEPILTLPGPLSPRDRIDNADDPIANMDNSSDHVSSYIDHTGNVVDRIDRPINHRDNPTNRRDNPINHRDNLIHQTDNPVNRTDNSSDHMRNPVDHTSSPVTNRDNPNDHRDNPGDHVSTHTKRTDKPIVYPHASLNHPYEASSSEQVPAHVVQMEAQAPGVPQMQYIPAASEQMLETHIGGLFYLINVALHLELYGDFTRPLQPGISLSIWDLLALLGYRLLGSVVLADPLWALLAHLAGRSAQEAPGNSFEPDPVWRLPPAWLAAFSDGDRWQWQATGERLHVYHTAGFLVLDVPLVHDGPVESQLEREMQPYREHLTIALMPREEGAMDIVSIAPLSDMPGITPAVARWLDWFTPYLYARLQRALGTTDNPMPIVCMQHAHVTVTTTHLDIALSLATLPLELRMAGLDRDPGWVPAAGHYIAFHFA